MRSRSKTTEHMSNLDKEEHARPRSKTAPPPKTDYLIKASQDGYFSQLLTNNPDTTQERHLVSQTTPRLYQQWLQAYCELVIVTAIEKGVHPMIPQARTEIVNKEKVANPNQNIIEGIKEKVIEHILHKKQLRQVVKDAIAGALANPQQLLKNRDSNKPMDKAHYYLSKFSKNIKRKPWLKPNNADDFLNMLSELQLIREENELRCARLEQSENIRHHGLFNHLAENQPINSTPDTKTKPSALTKGSSLPSRPTSK